MANTDTLPHVLIIGGGFGGLRCAQKLRRAPVRVTLVDRRNHHLFQPLLYQVATAGMMAENIAVPIRSVLRGQKNAAVRLGDVQQVDLSNKRVELADGTSIDYDYVVLAAGARTSYFGNDAWEQHTVGLKSVEDAYAIRRRVLLAFEAAEQEEGAAARRRLLTFVVIGGGPTGVEMAGALAELTRQVLARDFVRVHADDIRVMLLEAAPRLLLAFHPSNAENARHELMRLGVEVHTGRGVTNIDARGVHLGDELVESDLVVWAAGVTPENIARKLLGLEATQRGFVPVEQDCSLKDFKDAFAIGDCAAFISEAEAKAAEEKGTKPRPLPGVAPVAMQQGTFVANTIARELAGKPRAPFRYFDKGNMATIGKSRAVLEFGRLRMRGFLAWVAWIFVHVFFIVGFRNRALVLFDWTWAYLFNRRGARLIVGRLGRGRDGRGHSEESRVEQMPRRPQDAPRDAPDYAVKASWNKNAPPTRK